MKKFKNGVMWIKSIITDTDFEAAAIYKSLYIF